MSWPKVYPAPRGDMPHPHLSSGSDQSKSGMDKKKRANTAHWAFMRHLLDSVERSNVVQRIDAWAQPAVQAKNLVFNQGREREIVEQIGKVFPYVCISILAQTLVIETIHLKKLKTQECLGDLTGFMVAAENSNTFLEANLSKYI